MEEDSSLCSYSDDFEYAETKTTTHVGEAEAKLGNEKHMEGSRSWVESNDYKSRGTKLSLVRRRERAILRRQKYSDEMSLAKEKISCVQKECERLREQNLVLETKAAKLVARVDSCEEGVKHKDDVILQLRSSLARNEEAIAKLRRETEDLHASYSRASAERENRFLEERQRLQSVLEKHVDCKQANISTIRQECFEEAKRKEVRLDGLQNTLNEHLLMVARERDQLKQKEKLLESRYLTKLKQEREQLQHKKESLAKEIMSYEERQRELELFKQQLENEKDLHLVQLKRKEGLLAVDSARHESERKLDAEKLLILEKDNASLKGSVGQLQDEVTALGRERDVFKSKLLRAQLEVKSSQESICRLNQELQEKSQSRLDNNPETHIEKDCRYFQPVIPEGYDDRSKRLWKSSQVAEMLSFGKGTSSTSNAPLARSLYDEFMRL